MTNAAVGESNKRGRGIGKKTVYEDFFKNEFYKFIGCIILEVKYGSKG